MVFHIGNVYHDGSNGAHFIIVLERLEDNNEVTFRMVNITNWIILRSHRGKQSPSGEIMCPDLKDDDYKLLATTVKEYYRQMLSQESPPAGTRRK